MSVLSDAWIIHQSTKPTHVACDRSGLPYKLIVPPYSEEDQLLIDNWCEVVKVDIHGHKPFARPIRDDECLDWKPMIEPFIEDPIRYVEKKSGEHVQLDGDNEWPKETRKVISFGTSSYGYDVRLTGDITQIKVFTNVFEPEIDPKQMKVTNFGTPDVHYAKDGSKFVWIPAHSYLQGPTMEYFRIPRNVLVTVLGKSTYARSGLICNVTPIEPEFEGAVVIEIANVTSSPVRCYLEEGIAQFVFLMGNEPCLKSYKDKGGKYQGQTGLTYAKV